MSDFAGTEYDFAAGSLFGLRGWDMDDLGRLHGVTHREVWLPGENVSICKATKQIPCPGKPEVEVPAAGPSLSEQAVAPKKKLGRKKRGHAFDPSEYLRDELMTYTFEVSTAPRSCGEPTCYSGHHAVSTGHRFDPACGCGFWAYDEAGFAPHGSVIGVIEAFGKTTIGTKGFRAEKARIAGLCKNGSDGKPLSRSVVARLGALYPDAVLCDDMDQMVAVFEGVMRAWPEAGEEFWLRPVPPKDNSMSLMWRSLNSAYVNPFRYHFGGVV